MDCNKNRLLKNTAHMINIRTVFIGIYWRTKPKLEAPADPATPASQSPTTPSPLLVDGCGSARC